MKRGLLCLKLRLCAGEKTPKRSEETPEWVFRYISSHTTNIGRVLWGRLEGLLASTASQYLKIDKSQKSKCRAPEIPRTCMSPVTCINPLHVHQNYEIPRGRDLRFSEAPVSHIYLDYYISRKRAYLCKHSQEANHDLTTHDLSAVYTRGTFKTGRS